MISDKAGAWSRAFHSTLPSHFSSSDLYLLFTELFSERLLAGGGGGV